MNNRRFTYTGLLALLACGAAMTATTGAAAAPVSVTAAPHCSFVASGPSQNATEATASVQLACFDGSSGNVTVCLDHELVLDLFYCASYDNVSSGNFTVTLPCTRGDLVKTLASLTLGEESHRVYSEPRVLYCV